MAAPFRTTQLSQPRPGLLVLRAGIDQHLFSAFFLVGGLALVGFGLGWFDALLFGPDAAPDRFTSVTGGVCGALLAVLGAWLLLHLCRHDFDRDAGQWTRRHLGSASARPLADVLAVQLIPGGIPTYLDLWEVNLVLADRNQRRVNLSNHRELATAQRDAARLAEFLSVPLLAQLETAPRLHRDGRDLIVSTEPHDGAWAATYCNRALVLTGPERLEMHPPTRAWLVAAVQLGVAAATGCGALAVAGVAEPIGWERVAGVLIFAAFSVLFACLGLRSILAPSRIVFDRSSGRVTRRLYLTTTELPLSTVLAVQVVDGGWHDSEDRWRSWQCNLVLDDATTPRWNVSNHADLRATRDHAAHLAEFLDVPLLDNAGS
jgi:hypothetical protein